MKLQQQVHQTEGFLNLEILARQIVEGYISGMHKSPFHGFSAEFAEHKIYNQGESTKHIDWKLYAKTDKLYTKRYEEETNLRCHLIIDNSASMHYPSLKKQSLSKLNKIGFSALASACIMNMLKRQRDAVGLSVYSDEFEFYAPEKAGERHHHLLFNNLEKAKEAPLAEALLSIEGMEEVLISHDTLTLTKNSEEPWQKRRRWRKQMANWSGEIYLPEVVHERHLPARSSLGISARRSLVAGIRGRSTRS